MIHDLLADLNAASKPCIIRPRGVHAEAETFHFRKYICLVVYGHGMATYTPSTEGPKGGPTPPHPVPTAKANQTRATWEVCIAYMYYGHTLPSQDKSETKQTWFITCTLRRRITHDLLADLKAASKS